jgi:hypothetical protein
MNPYDNLFTIQPSYNQKISSGKAAAAIALDYRPILWKNPSVKSLLDKLLC